jgi:hypothetical protein
VKTKKANVESANHGFTHLNKENDSFSQTESKRDVRKLENVSHLSNKRDACSSEMKTERQDVKTKKASVDSANHGSTHLNKEHDSISETESKRDVSKSENVSYFPNKRDAYNLEMKTERQDVRTKKANVDSCRHASHTLPQEPVPWNFYQRDEYRPYSKYKAESYIHSEHDRSRTPSSYYASSEPHSHSEIWGSYKIPRSLHKTRVSQALRSLRSRSLSQSRTVPTSVQNTGKGRYDVRASSHARSPVLSETSDTHKNHALKVPDSDPSTYHLKSQLAAETKLEFSKDLSCKPQKKFTHGGEPHSEMGASSVELVSSLKMTHTEPGVKIQLSPYAKANLSEHGSFKRSTRPKIIKLNSETKPSEATNSVNNSDLVTNTHSISFCEHNQIQGLKRHLDSKERDEACLPDCKRHALDDITGRECHNYTEYDNSTHSKQKYNGRSKIELTSGSVKENLPRIDEFTKDESSNTNNTDIATLEEINTAKNLKEETVPQNKKLDIEEGEICEDSDMEPSNENTVEKKETICNIDIKSDGPNSSERDKRKKHKMAQNTDKTLARPKACSVESEGRKKRKCSNDRSGKLGSSKSCNRTMGKKEESGLDVPQIEAESIKHCKTTKKEEEIGKSTEKISLVESNKEDGVQDYGECQTESVKTTEDGRLNEEKEMKHGEFKEPITELAVSHDVVKSGAAEVSHKSASRGSAFESSPELSKVTTVINLKCRARRSMERKLEDSKVVLSVNITSPKAEVITGSSADALKVERLGTSAEKLYSASKTQK